MDKKGIIAISLAIITMVVWQVYFMPKPTPQLPTQVAKAGETPATAPAPVATPGPVALASGTQAATETLAARKIEAVSSPAVEYQFTNLGGGIATAKLLDHLGLNGRQVVLNEHDVVPIGALSDQPDAGAQSDGSLSVNAQAGEVVCERTTPEQLQIVKKFTLPKAKQGKDAYLLGLEVVFTNRGDKPYRSNGYYVHAGSSSIIHNRDLPMYVSFDWYRDKYFTKDVNWFSAGSVPLIGVRTSAEKAFFSESAPNIAWAGVRNQYFATILSVPGRNGSSVWARRFPVTVDEKEGFAIEGALGMPGFVLKPGETARQQFNLWVGPKQYSLLNQLGNDEDAIMNFGMFKIVSKTLLFSMNWLKGVLGYYGIAIIVLTLIIKTGMWPLQNASTKSMKKMQALQPKMKEFQAKYKDDPTRLNQETMKLYKEYGVNPVGGCLPMFVQIPIFFGFYSMLGTAIELRNSRFLWVKDLSQPDTLFHLAGFPVNILPLCMAVTMLWQMTLTPKSGDQTQQKVMMFMPLIFIAFCYNFASALALYWTVQNLFSIAQLYVTRNSVAPVLQKIAAPRKKR